MAAQFLSGQGFQEVYNLKGGIQAWQGGKAKGPVELNLDLIRGDESQEEMVVIAYGLEKTLKEFYQGSAREDMEEALLNLFRTLAAIEEKHQRLLMDLLPGLAGRSEAELKEERPDSLMEGGFRSEEFRRENRSFLSTPSGVLDLAMMIETQALDLYLRFAQKSVAEAVRAVLYRLADEEKAHLKALGQYRDQWEGNAPGTP